MSATETDVASKVSTDGVLMTGGDRDISSSEQSTETFRGSCQTTQNGQGSGQLAENYTKTDRQAGRQTTTPPQQLTRLHNHFIPPSAPNPLHTTPEPREPKFAQMRKPQHGIPPSLGLSSVMTHPPTPILLRPAAPFANALHAMPRRRASDAKSTRQQGPSPARALGTNTKGKCPHLQVQCSRDTHDPA